MSSSTQALSSTMQKLPELRRKQKVLDMHTVLATNLLNTIVDRQLDSFISMEESIAKLTTETIIQVLKDSTKKNEDKIRLTLMYALSVEISKQDMTQLETALNETGCDTSPLQYIK
jgi:tellurite resistance protein